MQRFIPTGLTVGLATLLFVSLVAATGQANPDPKLPQAVAGTSNAGVGLGLSPEPARGLGLKVESRCPTLLDMLNHYDVQFGLGLTDQDKSDLVQYLLSI